MEMFSFIFNGQNYTSVSGTFRVSQSYQFSSDNTSVSSNISAGVVAAIIIAVMVVISFLMVVFIVVCVHYISYMFLLSGSFVSTIVDVSNEFVLFM